MAILISSYLAICLKFRTKRGVLLRAPGQDRFNADACMRVLADFGKGKVWFGVEARRKSTGSPNQVGRDHTEEFTGADDLGVLPELGKMPLVSGHQVVGACPISTLNEHIVVWVGGHGTETRGRHNVSMVFDQLQELLL